MTTMSAMTGERLIASSDNPAAAKIPHALGRARREGRLKDDCVESSGDGDTFPAGTSALTPASQALLEAAQERLDGCIVGQVSLNAKSGDARSAREASSLSAARIETVATALEARDLSGMHLDSDTIATPATQTPWAPMDRKVEITLAAWAPEIS